MVKLVATSVVRGSQQGESHGGIYIVDFEEEKIYQPVDWNTMDIDWQGRGWDRGLRGIAFHKDRVFVVASDELFEYNPNFELIASHRNPYLKHCHEICVHEHHLFITSTAFDTILAFNLRKNSFDKAFMVRTDGQSLSMAPYDPNSDDGPLAMNKLHINNIFCDKGGMYISGLRTNGLLLYNGKRIGMSTTLPTGTHNARPFREGILFNDTQSDTLRYATRAGDDDCAFNVPQYSKADLLNTEMGDSRLARQGFGRGLCAISDTLIAAGSSPSTIALYDLEQKKRVKTVNISMDIRNAIHGLAVWPYY
ncbi:MAG: hypothetical protein IIB74_09350 [Proteobacteria bacterium]|nr:hypothetical protein [Pseudomonadota bacterium]